MRVDFDRLKQIAVPMTEEERRVEQERAENREARRYSALVALTVRRELRIKGISQQSFADRLGVSPQYLGKILKGNENLTLETIGKIERVIGRPILKVMVEEDKPVDSVYRVSYSISFSVDNSGYSIIPRSNTRYETFLMQ